jgi:hypothetical protein
MNYWAGLNSSVDQEAIGRGANTMLNIVTASQVLPRSRGPRSPNEVQDDASEDED